MFDSIVLLFIGIGFFCASCAIAINFLTNAYLDWQEQQIAIQHGIRVITERNSAKQEVDDDDSFD